MNRPRRFHRKRPTADAGKSCGAFIESAAGEETEMPMKEMPTVWTVMQDIADFAAKAYAKKTERVKGAIQFYLTYEGAPVVCALVADGSAVELVQGEVSAPSVSLTASFYDWLDLAAKRLHPVFGVMRGKLKFSGDTAFFSKIMPDENFWELPDGVKGSDPPTPFERNPEKYWRKPETALVINGSPRGERGYTDFYSAPFISGLEKGGVNVETVHLQTLKINPCTGCWRCWIGGKGECIFDGKDDFRELLNRQQAADLVVFAFPLYVDGVPGLMKNALDRCVCAGLPFMVEGPEKTRHPRRERKAQSMAVLSICGFPEAENFNAVRDHFRQISHNRHTPVVAEIFRSAAMYLYGNPTLFRQLNEVVGAIEKAGTEVARSGAVSRRTRKQIEQKLAPVSVFQKEADYYWHEKIKSADADY